MKAKKSKLILFGVILLLIGVCKVYSQSLKLDDKTWGRLKKSAHKIGLCVFHIEKKVCSEHHKIKDELTRLDKEDDSETFYFLMNQNWAKNRVEKWSERNNSNSSNYLLLFDINQNSFRKLYHSTAISNSLKGFAILDLRNNHKLEQVYKPNSLIFKIKSGKKNAIITNSMWREFMTNRLGKLDSSLKIELNGLNAKRNFKKFKKAFTKFTKR